MLLTITVFLGGQGREDQNVLPLCFNGKGEKCWPRWLRVEEKGEGMGKDIVVQLL